MNSADYNNDYSTQKISPNLISKIVEVLKNKAYGSIEIYIENFNVTQITERTITKLANQSSTRRRFSIKVIKGSSFSSTNRQAD